MKKTIAIIFSAILLTSPVYAELNIDGQPQELEQYLNGVHQTVSLSATEKIRVKIDSATVAVRVSSEEDKLSQALRKNLNLRETFKESLQKIGLKKEFINESKFTTTPEYGFLSKLPKSYKIGNIMTIDVDSEEQLIAVAKIVDSMSNVLFVSSKPKKAILSDVQINEMRVKAMEKLLNQVKFYQQSLSVKLTAISFSENIHHPKAQSEVYQKNKSSFSRSAQEQVNNDFSRVDGYFSANANYRVLPTK